MKAITYQKDQDTFTYTDIDTPALASGLDVLVKVHAIGLNPVDAKVNLWHEMVDGMNDTFVGGLDVSGEIVAIGDKVSGWQVGDRVLYHGNMRRMSGGFAEYAIHDSRTLVAHPNVEPEIAAATPCAGWTAYRALVDKLNISTRKSIFIAGGSGGVGCFAIQLARFFGVKTIITTSSALNHEFVRSLGATHVIDYKLEDVREHVMSITEGLGVEVSLDCVGGDNDILCASVLGFEGEMVELVRTTRATEYPGAFLQGLTFHQLSLGSGHVHGEIGFHSLVKAGSEFSHMLERGEITIPKLELVELKDVPQALIAIRQQRTVGKVVATITN
ncbi:zinc-binding dehydrogenase [Vibrio jasicida]|uniref:zinc-binding dehydrogenase n=1 Tax=Vibrio jasicida TaxID=766224 RepID=UPI00148E0A81|nr:zinc-binding dehydrogenase [Vibrio jasicida]NOJ19233.1 zinc-binding dehydrogenase [Vibrio jasicida]